MKTPTSLPVRSLSEETRWFPQALLVLIICLLAASPAQAGLRDRIEKTLHDRNGGSGELDARTLPQIEDL